MSLDLNSEDNLEAEDQENFIGEYVGGRSIDGCRDGFGCALLPNRDQYEGCYRKGLREGKGSYQFKNGARYDGEWRKGLKHGTGKFSYPDGSWYYGSWKNNKKHGFGKYLYENGDSFEGSWQNDKKHGVGTYSYVSPEISIKATWVENDLKGPIEIFYPTFRYHGYYKDSIPIGEGAFTFNMKYMMPVQVGMFPNPDFKEKETSEILSPRESKGSTGTKKESFKLEENQEIVQTEPDDEVPRCLPRLLTYEILKYDQSKLPQHPISLPTVDSVSTICTESSKSDSELMVIQMEPPLLIAADPIESDDEGNLLKEQKSEFALKSGD